MWCRTYGRNRKEYRVMEMGKNSKTKHEIMQRGTNRLTQPRKENNFNILLIPHLR